MRRVIPFLVLCGFTFLYQPGAQAPGSDGDSAPGGLVAQKEKEKGKFDPPKIAPPSEETLQQIAAKTAQLAAKIADLRKDEKHHDLLPDVEIFLRGAENIVRFKEYYSKDSGKWTLDCLDRGLKRAEQLAEGETPWTTLEKRNVVRGYRSRIDGSAQQYGVTYPLEYGKDRSKFWRVDVVLHGRDGSLTEVKYLNAHNGSKKVSPDQEWVQIDVFGRGNNAYRWAGETDVFEALRAFLDHEHLARRNAFLDYRRIVLRGFSMGGAGTWHLGLHFPDQWFVMGPGAGFTTTHGYAWKGKKELPDYQEKCLRIYDAIDYAENARMIPIVAYSGGDDPQKAAADLIEKRLRELKIRTMTHHVAPGLGHSFPMDWFKKVNADWSLYGWPRVRGANEVSFVTYSTKFWACDWIAILGLEKHYEKASVEAAVTDDGCRIKTKNVRELTVQVRIPAKNVGKPNGNSVVVEIDGETLKTVGTIERVGLGDIVLSEHVAVFLERKGGKWQTSRGAGFMPVSWPTGLRKRPFLQGPIDDAFASGFVCVTGTGETWHPATQKFVDAKVKAFEYDWAKHWRGELPITNEYGVTPNEIMEKHLILFGDPSSNFLLANILPKLPLKWTKDEIEFAGKIYKASEHVPVMIFPNPLNPSKYVVLNTGHTFPSEDYSKTNALLYPRLGDYAILRMTPTAKNAAAYEVATAGLFDEFWKVEK